MASLGQCLTEGTILVVEDDHVTRTMLCKILASNYPSLTVHSAGDGDSGLALFTRVRPDVVLTDLHMPRVSGIAMAEEIRAAAPDVPIIVLTASSDSRELLHSIRLGITRYVLKPVVYAQLFEAVEDAFRRIDLERQVKAQHDALRAREAQYRSIFENSLVGLLLLAEDGAVLDANPEACNIFGRCSEELRQSRWGELVEDETPDLPHADGKTHRELKVVRAGGGRVPVEVCSESYLDAEGRRRCTVVVTDISRRFYAERAAFLARNDWERTFDCSTEPIMIIDTDFRIRQANRAMLELTGARLEETLGQTCCHCMHASELPLHCCPHAQLMQDGLPHTAEVYEPSLGRHLFVSVTPLFDPMGKLVGSVHFAKDVTEQKMAEAALREGEERLRLALESAALGSCDIHLTTGEVFWDERCREMFALPLGEKLHHRDVVQMIHPDDRAIIEGAVQRALAGEEETRHWEFRVIWPDRSVHWIALHGRVYFEAVEGGRRARRFIGVSMDITHRVRAEEELRRSEARYRGLFNSLQEGFTLLETVLDRSRADYRFLKVNPAFEKLVGTPRAELIGRSIRSALPELGDEFLGHLSRVARSGAPVTVEYFHAPRERQLEAHIFSPAQGQLAVLYTDVSERRKLQEEREKNARLESLGVLAGGIAHDFNNILTAIAGNISLARYKLEGATEAATRLEESEKAVAKAAALTRQLLTFARGGAPVKKALAPGALITEAVSLFLSGTNCKAQLDLPDGLWGVHADPGQINQTLNNLLLNAVQAMPEGGVITIRAGNENVTPGDPRGVPAGRYVRIVITDRGTGIPPEILPKIFDPYFTTKATGTGLGLASVFSVIKRHNGMISATSQVGVGTSFEILLPALEVSGRDEAPDVRTLAPPAAGKSVLVMDDEEPIRTVAVRMLKVMGYAATACSDGAEAVRLYRDQQQKGEPFGAAILDMTVPGAMGGKDAARGIRDLDPNAVIVISSGYFAEFPADGEHDTPANAVVAKPYNLHQLSEVLAKVLRRSS